MAGGTARALEAVVLAVWAVPSGDVDVEADTGRSAVGHPGRAVPLMLPPVRRWGRRMIARYHLLIGLFKFNFDCLNINLIV
jgi:hypothetical protein